MEGDVKLYTRNDLERAARLATLQFVAGGDPEAAIQAAVASVAEDAPAYLDEPTIRKMLQYVAEGDYCDELYEEALEYAQR